jgi:putative spermidine/putrescine transport system substrate-binding protein
MEDATTMGNPPRPKRRAQVGRRSFLKSSLIAGAVVALGAPGREAGAQVGGTLTLTSYGGPWEEFMRSTIVPAFEKEHPGVKVELAIGLSKDWVAKLKAAGKDNPPYDVVTTNEVWAAPLRAEGRYAKLPHELVPNLKDVAPNLRIKDDMGVLALAGPIGLAYRVDKIKTVPKAWKDLWTVPEYKGKIGIYNIVNSAGQMTICLTSKIWTGGDKDIDAAYKKIAELKPFKQTDFSGDMEKLLVQGEVLVGILDMPAAVRLQKSGAPIGWVAPAEGMLMFEQDVAVTAGSKNKLAAFAYVNWMLKRETQETWLRQFYWLPANTRVKMPDELKSIMPVTQADIPKILQWDWLWINDQKPKLIDRWNREMST